MANIMRLGGGAAASGSGDHVPVLGEDFTYTGSCEVIDDSDEVSGVQWRIKFYTSGTLVTNQDWVVDLFLVGGGAAGGSGGNGSFTNSLNFRCGGGGKGGAGGEVKTITKTTVKAKTSYTITIGGSGGTTSALNQTASSGGGSAGGHSGNGRVKKGSTVDTAAVAGGNGANGVGEFGDSNSTILYGAGGGGGGGGTEGYYNDRGAGGSKGQTGGGYGGDGCYYSDSSIQPGGDGARGIANTGGGGGGGGGGSKYTDRVAGPRSGGFGGSGIAIIRKHKEAAA